MEQVYELANGRRYLAKDTGQPYEDGEYPKGGIHLMVWSDLCGHWMHLANCREQADVDETLRLLKRLPARQIPDMTKAP